MIQTVITSVSQNRKIYHAWLICSENGQVRRGRLTRMFRPTDHSLEVMSLYRIALVKFGRDVSSILSGFTRDYCVNVIKRGM
jgi:hypothetical protein